MAQRYAQIFVRGNYLFREANSFLRGKLEENCELRGTDNVQGQISVHIFEAKWMLCVYYPSNIFLQGRILGDLFFKRQRNSVSAQNVISLFKVFSFIHFNNLLGIKTKCTNINRKVLKLGNIYMLFTGWEVRIVKNCDRGLENAARGRRPRAAFSRPRSQFFTIRTDPKLVNNLFIFF